MIDTYLRLVHCNAITHIHCIISAFHPNHQHQFPMYRSPKTGKDPLFTKVDVGEGKLDTLPPGVKGLHDGGMVFVDHRRSRNTQTQTPFEMIHQGQMEDAHQPLASFFITMDHVLALTRVADRMGESSVKISPMPVRPHSHHAGGTANVAGYDHMILSVTLEQPTQPSVEEGKSVNIKLQVVPSEVVAPMAVAEMEEGEIEQPASLGLPYISRNFSSVLRMYASHVTETHKDTDTMYVHGMRKIAGYIGWFMCECPKPQTISIPSVPSWLTVEECALVIRRMDLEVFTRTADESASPADLADLGRSEEMQMDDVVDGYSAPVVNRHHPSEWDKDHRRYVPMHTVLQQAAQESDIIRSLNIAVKVREEKVLPMVNNCVLDGDQDEPRGSTDDGGNRDREKTSVYPMGMLASRYWQSGHL